MSHFIYLAVTRVYNKSDLGKFKTEFVDLYLRNPGKNYKQKFNKIPFSTIESICQEPVLNKEIKVDSGLKKLIEWYVKIPGKSLM